MQASITAVTPARNPGDGTVAGLASGAWTDDPVPVIEEFGPIELTRNRSNRRVGIVIALAAGIAGLGLLGHWSDHPAIATEAALAGSSSPSPGPRTAESADPAIPPFTVLSPEQGTTVMGGVVEVHGIARERLGFVHLSVVLGKAVLGWTNVDVRGPGPFDVAIRVFAPSFVVPVELRVIQASGPRLELSRSFNVEATASVTLWSATLSDTANDPVLIVDGFGSMTTGPIRLTVRSGDRAIATSPVAIGSEAFRPGSAGGQMIGLGSFRVRIPMPPTVGSAPLSVDLAWQDAFGDITADLPIAVDGPGDRS